MIKEMRPIILVVDDDPSILNSIISILKSTYRVVPVSSGEMALDYLSNRQAELILLDINLPKMNGYQVMEVLQKNKKTKIIPVIFLTSYLDESSESLALEKGAADYVTKPLKPLVLLKRIKMHLDMYNMIHNLDLLVENKTKNLKLAYEKVQSRENSILGLLARVTDFKDHELGDHCRRITEYCRVMVDDVIHNPNFDYELTRFEANDISNSAQLHDIGKIAIADKILLSRGHLNETQFNIMKTHTNKGAELLKEVKIESNTESFLKTASEITLGHHEKWNGKGYPNGFKEKSIPLSARVVAIADVYDALISKRPYKKAYSHTESIEIIEKDRGIHFDPFLAEIFIRNQDYIYDISKTWSS